jgi:hypothetical protein
MGQSAGAARSGILNPQAKRIEKPKKKDGTSSELFFFLHFASSAPKYWRR